MVYRCSVALVLCACFVATVHGAVLDVLAGDVVAQAPGDYALTSYFAERSSTGPYKAGALAGNAGTMPVTFGRYAEGTADLRLSATLWPVADRPFGGGSIAV
jgi:hypothetical protein